MKKNPELLHETATIPCSIDDFYAPDVELHTQPADIIVCVHNALDDVSRCLESIAHQTHPPYHLILVDDGSAPATCEYLQRYVERNVYSQSLQLIRNAKARGYTFAANQGMQASTCPYLVLLNSDTVVTPYWLDRLMACADSDERIGMVGPLSNTASWQSVPEIEYRGDWACNPLPLDMSVTQMAHRIAGSAPRSYPKLPFLNGFCLLIKRALQIEIGYFDEDVFGAGYGEENDYCLRAGKAGWILAVADDTYIYHAQSRSYSHERRKKLADRAGVALAQKHGDTLIQEGVDICRHHPMMQTTRIRVKSMLEPWQLIAQGQACWRGKKVCFVVSDTLSQLNGGILDIVEVMQRMSVQVTLLNIYHHQDTSTVVNTAPHLRLINVNDPALIPQQLPTQDIIIFTTHHSIAWITPLIEHSTALKFGYYIHSLEPYDYIAESLKYHGLWRFRWWRRRVCGYYFRIHSAFRQAWLSYYHPHIKRFCKTKQLQTEIQQLTGQRCGLMPEQPFHTEQIALALLKQFYPS